MTPAQAHRLGRRWLIVGGTLFAARTVLVEIGIEPLDLPVTVCMWLAFLNAVNHQGWENGYAARAFDEPRTLAELNRRTGEHTEECR